MNLNTIIENCMSSLFLIFFSTVMYISNTTSFDYDFKSTVI